MIQIHSAKSRTKETFYDFLCKVYYFVYVEDDRNKDRIGI